MGYAIQYGIRATINLKEEVTSGAIAFVFSSNLCIMELTFLEKAEHLPVQGT